MCISQLLILTACAATTFAFVVKAPTTTRSFSPRISRSAIRYQHKHLSEVDEMCVENAAAYCLENDLSVDCDLEEHDALVRTLEDQREYHREEVQTINSLLFKLGQRESEDVNHIKRGSISHPIRHHHLDEIDEMCIENAARYCLEADAAASTECDLTEIEALITTLQEQDEFHLEQLETINDLLGKLEAPPGYLGPYDYSSVEA